MYNCCYLSNKLRILPVFLKFGKIKIFHFVIGKDPDAGRDWGQEEKGTTEDEMAGWHHQPDGRVWVTSGSW